MIEFAPGRLSSHVSSVLALGRRAQGMLCHALLCRMLRGSEALGCSARFTSGRRSRYSSALMRDADRSPRTQSDLANTAADSCAPLGGRISGFSCFFGG